MKIHLPEKRLETAFKIRLKQTWKEEESNSDAKYDYGPRDEMQALGGASITSRCHWHDDSSDGKSNAATMRWEVSFWLVFWMIFLLKREECGDQIPVVFN